MARKPDEFTDWPARLAPDFGPYHAVVRWDARYDDGDTLWVMADPGFNRYDFMPIRLEGIDAPELRGVNALEEGRAARAYLFSILPYNAKVKLYTDKDPDKYGRYVGTIFALNTAGEVTCINVDMVRAGHAATKPEWGWDNVVAYCQREGVAV